MFATVQVEQFSVHRRANQMTCQLRRLPQPRRCFVNRENKCPGNLMRLNCQIEGAQAFGATTHGSAPVARFQQRNAVL
ncbi:MAG: hypothetical protein CL801_12615 [Citromicrobium sp.]|nr:hypothetical protein WG75_14810 [Citromicrobium sp. WPS32]MBO82249.1 hypothetical protein [Citromicrobium sp.]